MQLEQKQFEEIKEKIDLIIRLLALNLVKDAETQKDKIIALRNLGFKPAEIAEILGTTANTVRVTLSKIRRKSSSKKAEKENTS